MDIKAVIIDHDVENRLDITWNLDFFGGFKVVGELETFEELNDFVWEETPDIAFVSLGLPTSDGFYCTYFLQKRFPDIKVIMMSDVKEYAFLAYEQGIFDYIQKPVEPMRMEKTITRIREVMKDEEAIINSPKSIMVKLKGKLRMLDLEDIVLIEMRNRKCSLTLTDGSEVALQRYTMEQLDNMFSPFGFFRCYQSIIIKLSKVSQLVANSEGRNCEVYLRGLDMPIAVSRDKYNQLVALLEEESNIVVTGNVQRK